MRTRGEPVLRKKKKIKVFPLFRSTFTIMKSVTETSDLKQEVCVTSTINLIWSSLIIPEFFEKSNCSGFT